MAEAAAFVLLGLLWGTVQSGLMAWLVLVVENRLLWLEARLAQKRAERDQPTT